MSKSVKVIISKTYEYPISVLNKDFYIEDSTNKAYEDIDNDINEYLIDNFKNINRTFFNIDAEIIENNKVTNSNSNISIDMVLTPIVTMMVEKELKTKLNPTTHPQNYFEGDLKQDINTIYERKYQELLNLFDTFHRERKLLKAYFGKGRISISV